MAAAKKRRKKAAHINKRAIAALLALVILAGIVLTIFFTTKSTSASADADIYTLADVEAARDEGYTEGVGDKAQYEETIAKLKQAIIDNEKAAKAKYDAMVAYYEAEIKRLTNELTRKIEYAKQLETYLIDLTIELADPSNSTSALGLQLAAYRTIESNILLDISHWTQTYNSLPDTGPMKTKINNFITQRPSVVNKISNYERALAVWTAIKAIVNPFIYPYYYKINTDVVLFNNYSVDVVNCSTSGYNSFMYQFNLIPEMYYNNDLINRFRDLNIDSFVDRYNNTYVNNISANVSGVNKYSTLLNNYLNAYLLYSGSPAHNLENGYYVTSGMLKTTDGRNYNTLENDISFYSMEISNQKSSLNYIDVSLLTLQTEVEYITEQKTIAEYILSTSANSLIEVRKRITEVESQIQNLESEVTP